MIAFAEFLRAKRIAAGLSQKGLATRARLCSDTIRRIEQRGGLPAWETIEGIAAGFGVPVLTLLIEWQGDQGDARRAMHALVDALPEDGLGLASKILAALVDDRCDHG